jgi:formylglycine-generating enzyme required for sulfatase activity
VRRCCARAALDAYRADAARESEVAREVLPLRQAVTTRPMTAEESTRLLALDGELAALGRALEGRRADVIEAVNLARGLDPTNVEAEAVLADLALERWRAALAAGDAAAARQQRAEIEAHDCAGAHAAELGARVELVLQGTPPAAEVFLFRYEEQSLFVEGGEPRLVPVPVVLAGEPAPAPPALPPPGTWALRITAAAEGLEPEDLVLAVAGHPIHGTLLVERPAADLERLDRLVSIDGRPALDLYDAWACDLEDPGREREFVFERGGERLVRHARKLADLASVALPRDLVARGGVPIEVFRRGVRERIEAPPPLRTRTSAAPLYRCAACRAGTIPLGPLALEPGSYLALVDAPGFESQRVPFVLERGRALALTVALEPKGTGPEGFVPIAGGPVALGGDPEAFATLEAATPDVGPFWIQEREVTVREYLEFVNAPETLEEIQRAREPIRYARDSSNAATGGEWSRAADGSFVPDPSTLGQPMRGVSWHDAHAYAAWLTRRARAEGRAYVFDLPSELEWEKAARGADRRPYPFGSRFVPRWVKSFFARDQPLLEPVLRFPIDESPYGVFDLTGGVWEWCADDVQGAKVVRGGAWNFIFPPFFRAASRAWQGAETADGVFGIRLVARRAR